MAIVVVTKTPGHAIDMFDWAWRLAQSRGESLTVLAVEESSEDTVEVVNLREGLLDDAAPILKTLRAKAESHPEPFDDDPETPPLFVRHLRSQNIGKAVIREADRVDASLVIVRGRRSHEEQDSTLGQHLYVYCHRALMVVTGSTEALPRHILVPTAEGCHTQEALKTAYGIVTESRGELTALYVQLAKDEVRHGEQILDEALREAGLSDAEHIVRRVDTAETIIEGISAAKVDHDAVFYGAPRRGDPKKALLDLVPHELVDDTAGHLVAVVRAERTLLERFKETFDRMVHLWVPQMERQRRKEIYEQLEEQSAWGFDFKMLMALSTCIASFGLIQNSAAVVIGAMLVAPLMTPMLCAGMALQQGNQQLLINNARSITGGFLTAVTVAFIVGMISPIHVPTPEMLGRGSPTLLDLGVALVSGFAAAYAFSRGEKLAAMLPGVAIAAALVPPIATTGVCLSLVLSTWLRDLFRLGSLTGAGDAAHIGASAGLLFLTNVVAIILGASVAFYSFGIRRWDPEPWVKRVTQGLLVSILVLAIPLCATLWNMMEKTSPRLATEVTRALVDHKPYSFKSLTLSKDRLEIYLRGPHSPSAALVAKIRKHVIRHSNEDIVIDIITETSVRSTQNDSKAEYLGTIRNQIEALVKKSEEHELLRIAKSGDVVDVTLRGPRPPSRDLLKQLQVVVSDRYGPSALVRVSLEWSFKSPIIRQQND